MMKTSLDIIYIEAITFMQSCAIYFIIVIIKYYS